MRKEEASYPVIEWSATRVTLFDPVGRKYSSGANIGEIASQISAGRSVMVALSRRSSFIRIMRVPDAPKSQVAQILQLQLPSQLPIRATDIAFDFRLSSAAGEEGKVAIVAAVAGETLRLIDRELKAAGLTARAVVPSAFGSWLLAQSLDAGQSAVAERVNEGLAIDIISEGELRYTRITPFPKETSGVEEEVCRTFAVAKVPCSPIIATGGLAFDTADTTVATRPLELLSNGALLQKLDLNIEPPEALALKAKKELNAKARQAMICWLGVLAVGMSVSFLRQSELQRVQNDDAPYKNKYGQFANKLSLIKKELDSQSGLQSAVAATFQPAQTVTDVISAFSSKVPQSKMWLGGFTFERGKLLMIRGTSLDSDSITSYVQSLAIDPRFRDVKLVFDQNGTMQTKPVQEFSIQAHVVGNLPVPSDSAPSGGGS